MDSDVKCKRAKFNQRNNEIIQEFHFANPSTKCHLNNIYNMSFSGSPLWDLFSEEAVSLEKTFNKAVRLMWNIPLESHRYLIEPITSQVHLKFVLLKRFLNFRNQILKTSKPALKSLMSICEKDCRSVTGRNLRKTMLLCQGTSTHSLTINDLEQLKYFPVPNSETWRIPVLKELLQSRLDYEAIPGFSSQEITDMIHEICVS